MQTTVIHKSLATLRVTPNLTRYDATCSTFDWAAVPDPCEGMPGGGCNIAYAALDRHAESSQSSRTALRFVAAQSGDGVMPTRDVSFAELGRLARQYTYVLRALRIGKGDRVFTLLGHCLELYVGVLGALRNGSVVCPLFSAFGPEPISTRLEIGAADVLITSRALYDKKIAQMRPLPPSLRHVFVVDEDTEADTGEALDFWRWMNAADDDAPIESTSSDDPALLHFTSGTTGTPKGALHRHGAVNMHYLTGLYALDLHRDDVFWCTADPGWVTGMSYGVVTPLVHGVTSVVDQGDFDAERWYDVLDGQRVTVWYTAPTALRMLIKAGTDLLAGHQFSNLRFIASVGEPLNPEAVLWGDRVFGLPVHDNWWQTETGGIMIANTPAFDVKPGSMGRPLPGVHAAVIQRHADGSVSEVEEPDVEGELALRTGWPSMFTEYVGERDRYRACFVDGWYLSGDLVKRDADGYFWFVGRRDDVIKSAGHLIGPFEVESVLTEHPSVAEAAVIGVPDPVVGERVKAFVTLQNGVPGDDALRIALLAHARKRLGATVAPKEIRFVDSLPHTRSGKIMRRLLKARELGLPEGDTSTVEEAPPRTPTGAT